jgi:excisionase family DNA binding protein
MITSSLNLTLSLNDIALDPSKAKALSAKQAQDMLFSVSGLIPVLLARTNQISPDSQPQREDLITVKEAAEIIHMSPDWIYRHKGSLPYVVKIGRCVRINRTKLNKHIKESRI